MRKDLIKLANKLYQLREFSIFGFHIDPKGNRVFTKCSILDSELEYKLSLKEYSIHIKQELVNTIDGANCWTKRELGENKLRKDLIKWLGEISDEDYLQVLNRVFDLVEQSKKY